MQWGEEPYKWCTGNFKRLFCVNFPKCPTWNFIMVNIKIGTVNPWDPPLEETSLEWDPHYRLKLVNETRPWIKPAAGCSTTKKEKFWMYIYKVRVSVILLFSKLLTNYNSMNHKECFYHKNTRFLVHIQCHLSTLGESSD